MQGNDKNELEKPQSAAAEPEVKKELSEEELAAISAGMAHPPRRDLMREEKIRALK